MDIESDSRKRPAPRGTSAYPRKRAVAACQTCRSRKTKCDNRRPICSFCDSAGATCIYSAHDLSAYDPASLSILDRLGQLEDNLKAHISMSLSASPASIATPSPGAARPNPAVSNIESASSSSASHIDNTSRQDAQPLANTVEHILKWPVFGSRFKEHAELVQLLRTSAPLTSSRIANFDLDTDTCKQLLHRCIEHVLSKNPVLEEDFLRNTMNSVCVNGIGWDVESCLVLLVCALGSIASPDACQADWITASSYFGAAQRRFGLLIAMDDLIVPQCYFLAGVYFMYHLRPVEAWRMFAQGVVCIYPDGFGTEPLAHYSLKECVYWSCWKSEVELRMHFQLPNFGVIGNRYPQHIPEPPVTDPSHEPKWYYYLADISLRRLDMDVRDTVAATLTPTATDTRTQCIELLPAVPALEEHLEDWTRSMPDVFSILDPEENVLHSILEGRLLDIYDVLYIPFLEGALAKNLDHGEATAMLNTLAGKALQCCVKRMSRVEPGLRARHHGTWLALRTCMRSALMILAARSAERLDLLPERWESAVVTAASVLSQWQNESPDVKDRFTVIRSLSAEVGLELPV